MHLTNSEAKGDSALVAAEGSDAAGAPRIEITNEMIEAGAEAIRLFEAGDAELAAFACFTAMARLASPVLCTEDAVSD
jgi:hypothetical protein